MSKKINRKIECYLDTSVVSLIFKDEKNKSTNEVKWFRDLSQLVENASQVTFHISALVFHEIMLFVGTKGVSVSKEDFLVIVDRFNKFFKNRVKFLDLNYRSAQYYPEIFSNSAPNSSKKNHKIDALIVVQAVEKALSNDKPTVWLITQDNQMKKYPSSNIMLYDLSEALAQLNITPNLYS